MAERPAVFGKNSANKVRGTKSSLHNSQLLISSGIPSLDHVIGGGLPLGSVYLIEEDKFGKYSSIMFKYFLSEGIVCNHEMFLASLDNNTEKMIYELPSPTNTEGEVQSADQKHSEVEDMKIAWRYNSLNPVQSSMNSSLQFGHYYDITKPIDRETITNASIHHWKADDPKRNVYENLLSSIKRKISNGYEKNESRTGDNVLRIAIDSIGSPFWDYACGSSSNACKELINCIYGLRAITRATFTVVLLTIPSHLFEKPETIMKIRHSVDGCIRLDSFVGTDREENPALRDYHGLFYMMKPIAMHTLVPCIPPTLDLAFKLRRKKFVIEKLHLPPELQESSEREQDDGSSFGCVSIKQKNLDF